MPIRTLTLALIVGLLGLVLAAQDAQPGNQPQAQATQSQPAAGQTIMTKVIEVRGDVQHAPLGEEEPVWEACKLGSYVKQHVDMAKALEFKAALEEIGEAFAETKK